MIRQSLKRERRRFTAKRLFVGRTFLSVFASLHGRTGMSVLRHNNALTHQALMRCRMPSPNGNAGLHVRWEKAGLVLDALPIPWNADAVLVEANVRLPRGNTEKTDFALRLGEEASPLPAELIVRGEGRALSRILFRLPVPAQSARTRVHWREHPLGEIEIPVLERQAILDSLALELPSIHVTLGTSTVACGAFVGVWWRRLPTE